MGRMFLVLIVFAALVVALRAARSTPSAAGGDAAGRKRRWPWEILAAALLVVAVFGLFWRRWFDT